MFRPTDSFHSSPYPHFECLQSCYVHLSHCPCLCAVKGYAPNQRFNHSFLEASFQSSPQELFPLYESFFSHCNPSPDFSVTFGIIRDHTSQVAELFYLFYSLSFNYYHHSCFLSFFYAYLHHFCLFSVLNRGLLVFIRSFNKFSPVTNISSSKFAVFRVKFDPCVHVSVEPRTSLLSSVHLCQRELCPSVSP